MIKDFHLGTQARVSSHRKTLTGPIFPTFYAKNSAVNGLLKNLQKPRCRAKRIFICSHARLTSLSARLQNGWQPVMQKRHLLANSRVRNI
jgi:hypothetical protein